MDDFSVDQVAFSFDGKQAAARVFSDVSFGVQRGQIIGIMGASGSGKSTLLRLLAGLLKPTAGDVAYGGTAPRIGYLFQDDVVLPWRTVGGNLQYPLEAVMQPAATRAARARQVCEAIRLNPAVHWNRYPHELSGGERRRLAVGMAIAREVDLLLLDEPTSNLDEKNKWLFQDLIQALWATSRPSIVMVTHDLDEAIVLSDRLLVLDSGRLVSTVDIPLARPRRPQVRSDLDFVALRQTIAAQLAQLWDMEVGQ